VEFEKGHRDDAQEYRKNERSDIHASGGNGSTIQKSTQLGSEMPSNVVEKGVIYFLARSRVDLEDPHAVADLQRSYIVLRPLPKNAKLGDGPIPEGKASRLIALPKKTLPRNRRDRFMAFVEKSKTSTKVLKETFFQGEEYETQSKGTRHTQPVTPVGEGVYAITTTGRTSHLVYILAIPSEPGQVQNDLGIHDRGSFVLSLKNPTIGGPSWATLSEKPNFPKSIQDDFRGLRWMPIQKSEYLDYPNSQLLLIGEAQGNLGGGAAPAEEDQKNGDKMTPEEELNRLEEEEEARIEHLHGDDSIFDDLHIDKTDYPHVLSTW
jgi:uroporphyrinogen-III synthase